MLDTLTTDKNGHAESKELPICTYNEDGSFKEDIHYTVVETKAADGYILDETTHDVTLRYDDNAPDVIATLKLINVPTEPKLPQTGDNANPPLSLSWNWCTCSDLLQVLDQSDFVERKKRINSNRKLTGLQRNVSWGTVTYVPPLLD